jgi:hypothetical protein
VTKKDLANASESVLAQAYLKNLLTIEESVRLVSQYPENPAAGLSDLLKLATEKLRGAEQANPVDQERG